MTNIPLESRIKILPMMTEERKNLPINYSFAPTDWGEVLLASSPKGLSALYFSEDRNFAVDALRRIFTRAIFTEEVDDFHRQALRMFDLPTPSESLTLHLRGTDFQHLIWNMLLKIPFGTTTTYAQLAVAAGNPDASRAVGTAVGRNPVSILIPCHRVIETSGEIGNYRWGAGRKRILLEIESRQNG